MNPMPIALAAVVGLTITLYRNEVLHAAARTVGQEPAYLKLEAALGGPGFGTPRFVESMAKAADALPDIPPPAPTSTSTSEPSESETRTSSTTPASTSTTTSAPTPTPTAETRKVSAVTTPSPPRPAAAPAPRPQAETPNPVFKQPKGAKKAKGNEFDPLNPSL
jgi:hypothetical protein